MGYKLSISKQIFNHKTNTMKVLQTIKPNLKVVSVDGSDYVMSYDTLVARIDYKWKTINVLLWSATCVMSKNVPTILNKKITHSNTTSRHINEVAKQMNFKVIKPTV